MAAVFAAAMGLTWPAAAQTLPGEPGPWALDVRGVTGPVPDAVAFYPPLDATALVPDRGFGVEAGAHVYLFDVGAARLGVGLSVLNIRATTSPPEPVATGTPAAAPAAPTVQSLQLDLRTVSPQVSLNFGTRAGWSYLSGGPSATDLISRTTGVGPGRRESGRLTGWNAGGGARWFVKSHLAFTFDLRLHRIGAGSGGMLELGPRPGAPSGPDVPPVAAPTPVPTPGLTFLTLGAGFSFR